MAERENCILVVDDHPPLLAALKELLELSGYRALTALSGEEALRLMDDAEVPTLIVADVLMPQMDGYTFVRELKAKNLEQTPPVIVVTAKDQLKELFVLEGVADYVTKPFQAQDLLDKISKHLTAN